jgi:hypothetical protein
MMLDRAKPHIHWKTGIRMSNELITPAVPAWMKAKSHGASIGNIDASDLKPPRLKVLAGMSPEVMDGAPGASPGNFWLTIFNLNLGKEVIGTPILIRKSYALWAPKIAGGEQKGPLATASDGVNWDVPNQVFEIRFSGNARIYKWATKRTVAESGLGKFGSSQDDDPRSKPAATLTYDTLWLIDLPNRPKQLCAMTVARTGVKPMQTFISALRAQGVDHYFQRYALIILKQTGPTGDPYYLADYRYLGNFKDEERAEAEFCESLYQQYAKSGFVTDLEEAADSEVDKPRQRHPFGPDPDETDTPF